MEELMNEFSFLSSQALMDKNFDPSNIQDLMKLFEVEAYKSWAAMELECQAEADAAETAMQEAEDELNSALDSAMDEFQCQEAEDDLMVKQAVAECLSFEKQAMAEYNALLTTAEASRKMGKSMEKAATAASNKYIQAALNSATNSMRSASKAISSRRVHPSN
ncbi:uncharacterized protein LOC141623530 [Silene latifolia]|uniref:uncharacterized protein LOC141623530 n=1 Tax=Silene latifolia TaxID=37657 RepID=UPI003D78909A